MVAKRRPRNNGNGIVHYPTLVGHTSMQYGTTKPEPTQITYPPLN